MESKKEMGRVVRLIKTDMTLIDKVSLKNIFKLYKAWREIKNEPVAIILYKFTEDEETL